MERSYTYDALGRLSSMVYSDSKDGDVRESYNYEYDKNGKITKKITASAYLHDDEGALSMPVGLEMSYEGETLYNEGFIVGRGNSINIGLGMKGNPLISHFACNKTWVGKPFNTTIQDLLF